MSQTLQYVVKNTFIDGFANDADAFSDRMCRCRSEPQPQKRHLGTCDEDELQPHKWHLEARSKDLRWQNFCDDGVASDALSRVSTCASSASLDSFHADDDKGMPFDRLTTVVARNFPASYTNRKFVTLLDSNGFNGKYDFAYLPTDFNTSRSYGYAFINFVTHQDACEFQQWFNGFTNWQIASKKVGLAQWSDSSQGLEVYVDRYQNSPVMHESVHDDLKPMIFKDGKRIPFPPATKVLKMPCRTLRGARGK